MPPVPLLSTRSAATAEHFIIHSQRGTPTPSNNSSANDMVATPPLLSLAERPSTSKRGSSSNDRKTGLLAASSARQPRASSTIPARTATTRRPSTSVTPSVQRTSASASPSVHRRQSTTSALTQRRQSSTSPMPQRPIAAARPGIAIKPNPSTQRRPTNPSLTMSERVKLSIQELSSTDRLQEENAELLAKVRELALKEDKFRREVEGLREEQQYTAEFHSQVVEDIVKERNRLEALVEEIRGQAAGPEKEKCSMQNSNSDPMINPGFSFGVQTSSSSASTSVGPSVTATASALASAIRVLEPREYRSLISAPTTAIQNWTPLLTKTSANGSRITRSQVVCRPVQQFGYAPQTSCVQLRVTSPLGRRMSAHPMQVIPRITCPPPVSGAISASVMAALRNPVLRSSPSPSPVFQYAPAARQPVSTVSTEASLNLSSSLATVPETTQAEPVTSVATKVDSKSPLQGLLQNLPTAARNSQRRAPEAGRSNEVAVCECCGQPLPTK